MDTKKAALVFLFGSLLGAFGSYLYFVPSLQNELKNAQMRIDHLQKELKAEQQKPPQVQTETVTKTEIQYVPKTSETIIYRDLATGEEITKQETEKTDIELSVNPPSVHMKYNRKEYELSGIAGENTKFEQGKLVGEVSTIATLDVTELVDREADRRLEEQKKRFSVGLYGTNQGLVGSVGAVNKNIEYRILGKISNIKEFYGAGLEVNF